MEPHPNAAPRTQMDALRALLGGYVDGDLNFQPQLVQLLHQVKKAGLPELGERLQRAKTPRGLKRMIISLVPKFEWPEWVPVLLEALTQESDLGVFDEGCAVLGALGTSPAVAALRKLLDLRTDNDRKVILNRELAQLQPQQSTDYYLGRLMEGQGNPRLAHQGARLLAVLATSSDLPPLIEAHQKGDELTRKLALRLITGIPDPHSAAYLKRVLDETRQAIQDDHLTQATIPKLQGLQRAAARDDLMHRLAAYLDREAKPIMLALQEDLGREGADPTIHLQGLARMVKGSHAAFLVDALTLLVEGKLARYNAFLSETLESLEPQIAEAMLQCDQVAEALIQKMDAGEISREDTSRALAEAFRARTGSDVLMQAFLRILGPGDQPNLDELLQEPDLNRRLRYLDILGAREDDAFAPFFLKAMSDPIVEVGLKAIHHLGKLPSSFPKLLDMFHSGHRDQLRLAIRVFGENHTRAAAEPLLDLIQGETSDEILVEAVDALGNIIYPPASAVLLDLLHDGKPLNLQLALCRALGRLATPQASLGLLQKAPNLKHPKVLILCLEGSLKGFPDFAHPFPVDVLPDLLQLVERCCDEREGEGQRFRAMMAIQALFTFDQKIYERLKDRFSDFLFEMRTRETWDRDSNEKVSAVLKELGRCSASLGLLAQKEANLQTLFTKIPPAPGPARAEALMACRDALADPDLILRPDFAQSMLQAVLKELGQGQEWKETAFLCEIGGRLGRPELLEPIRDIYLRATGVGLKSAARSALVALGLSPTELDHRAPIRSVLVLEPSAFFRKRLVSALASRDLEIRECADRGAAERLLSEHATDLLLTESQDASGSLSTWIAQQWAQKRCRYVLLSASSRDLGGLPEQPWVIGTLFKPYPQEQILLAIGDEGSAP